MEQAQKNLHQNEVYQELLERVPKVALSIDGLFTRPAVFSHTAVLYRMWEDAPFTSVESLSAITNDAIVLHTTRDDLHPISVAETIANQLPNSQTQSLPPRYDDPVNYGLELNKVVGDFLG